MCLIVFLNGADECEKWTEHFGESRFHEELKDIVIVHQYFCFVSLFVILSWHATPHILHTRTNTSCVSLQVHNNWVSSCSRTHLISFNEKLWKWDNKHMKSIYMSIWCHLQCVCGCVCRTGKTQTSSFIRQVSSDVWACVLLWRGSNKRTTLNVCRRCWFSQIDDWEVGEKKRWRIRGRWEVEHRNMHEWMADVWKGKRQMSHWLRNIFSEKGNASSANTQRRSKPIKKCVSAWIN